jgi:acyl carrier protein phosphodiesterase
MNFLSHFYFDRYTNDPNIVLGTVLPDLVKNARKDWNLHPEKKEALFTGAIEQSILTGWKRHLLVDRHFHNSGFFFKHTKAIRTAIAPVLIHSPVRPSFLAHIGLELMLDSILLTDNIINPDRLYSNLRQSDRLALNTFLELCKMDDTVHFFKFFDKFIEASYLNSYRESHNIMYALNRICMRIWPEPLNDTQLLQLSAILLAYYDELQGCYMEIFNDISPILKEAKN